MVFVNGGTALPQPEDPDLCIGTPMLFHREITPPPPPDRLHPGQPDSARPCIRRSGCFPVTISARGETDENRVKFICERRRYVVDYSGRNSHEPQIMSTGFTRILRSEPHFHDVDCACLWAGKGFLTLIQPSPPNSEQVKFGSNRVRYETCWYQSDELIHAFIRAIQAHGSRSEFFKNMVEVPHGWTNVMYHSSSKQYFANMLLHGLTAGGIRRNEDRRSCYCLPKSNAVTTDRSLRSSQVAY